MAGVESLVYYREMRPGEPVDIDDLLTSCRSENARRAFGEAVAAYRAGAYRACVVVTWTAVVFDYVGKLRELELAGNGEATKALVDWESARRNGDVTLSMRLEEQLLSDAAERFDLLTPIERQDLERLRLDRHRCAHPSLLTLDEPYQPSAELARVHMRHAVTHLLSRPPVQGKEAWDRVWADVSSEYFPEDVDSAALRLHAVMSRARVTLVRKLVIELTRGILAGDDETSRRRFRAALLATRKLHHSDFDQVLREKLAVLAEKVRDDGLDRLVFYCANVSGAWDLLGAPSQDRVRLYLEKSEHMPSLADAWQVLPLQAIVHARCADLDGAALAALARLTRAEELREQIVQTFETSTSFTRFAALRGVLKDESLLPLWSGDHRRRLTIALANNDELRRYGGYGKVVQYVLALCAPSPASFRDEWRAVFDQLADVAYLAKDIREAYPAFPAPPEGAQVTTAEEPS